MRAAGFTPLGDAALVVVTEQARALRRGLTAQPPAGLLEVVPALGQLTLLYDPLRTDAAALETGVRAALNTLPPEEQQAGQTVTVPVTFDGPDLAWCAAHSGLSEAAFVAALCAAPLEVAFLGFTPGFGFLTGLPRHLHMPRLDTPRPQVPAGSVALGGPWAGVYPRATPGGWRIVGHTHVALFDLSRPQPVRWQAGDRVRFEEFSLEETGPEITSGEVSGA